MSRGEASGGWPEEVDPRAGLAEGVSQARGMDNDKNKKTNSYFILDESIDKVNRRKIKVNSIIPITWKNNHETAECPIFVLHLLYLEKDELNCVKLDDYYQI
ncbi:hypothetical protein PPACK8108_LOCUS8245 [Phakopsora pachyrhizi]|uniref:Uncharacterized protein n=1 Tax=Phakopsora pachyrhizi TaxID=170000 RepID=A0AAV0AUC7_PHAPC|nr:hypothetical protein PPACK8108_LOCUS8245 [Phakopsora pachyrhizi]